MTASPDVIFNTTQIPHLLTVLIFLPTAGVAVMAFFQNDTHIKHVAFWTSAAEFCLSLSLPLTVLTVAKDVESGDKIAVDARNF